MTRGVIITGSRWGVTSDAATFPSWYFYEALKDRIEFDVWTAGNEAIGHPYVHSIWKSIPQNYASRSELIKTSLGWGSSLIGFCAQFLQTCENADFIVIFFRSGNALVDVILRNWGHKSLLHLTDNYLLFHCRAKAYRYTPRAFLEQLHCARLASRGVVFVSETDRVWFAKFFPWRAKDTFAIPLGVDSKHYHPASQKEVDERPGCTFLFTGDLSYAPNSEACRYLIQHILPALPKNITMVFGGRRPPDFLVEAAALDKRIQVTGFVEDLSQIYRNSDVMLAPIFHGAGMQNKLLEATSSGLPCITTPVCAKAFSTSFPNFLIADNADSFISHALEMHANPHQRRQLGLKGRDHVESNYSWEARAETLLQLALP
jgi:glycosyltransferase involved in cell wall biosynthesis